MNTDTPINYQAALDAYRNEEHTPDNPVRSADAPVSPPMTGGCVDYEAASKAWDREQEGKNIIHLQTGKRNSSHDPIYRK